MLILKIFLFQNAPPQAPQQPPQSYDYEGSSPSPVFPDSRTDDELLRYEASSVEGEDNRHQDFGYEIIEQQKQQNKMQQPQHINQVR